MADASSVSNSPSTAAEVGLWVAALAGVLSLAKQVFDLIRTHRKERNEIESALEQQPLIRQQLELGNVGEAVKHLNMVILSQAQHMKDQDARLQRFQERVTALEAETESWERKVDHSERQYRQLKWEHERLEREHERLQREFESSAWRHVEQTMEKREEREE